MGQEGFLAVDCLDLVKNFCATLITSFNSIFTSYVESTKICFKIISCIKKIISCAIKVTHNEKYTQPTETVAPATVCAPCPHSNEVQLQRKIRDFWVWKRHIYLNWGEFAPNYRSRIEIFLFFFLGIERVRSQSIVYFFFFRYLKVSLIFTQIVMNQNIFLVPYFAYKIFIY